MFKATIIALVILGSIKFGSDYILSPQFQAYADRTKAPWTCQLDNTLAQMYMVFSRYDDAIVFFQQTVNRCPDGEMAQVAEFEIAEALSKSGHNREAVDAYRRFVQKYPGTKRAKIAERAADIIQVS